MNHEIQPWWKKFVWNFILAACLERRQNNSNKCQKKNKLIIQKKRWIFWIILNSFVFFFFFCEISLNCSAITLKMQKNSERIRRHFFARQKFEFPEVFFYLLYNFFWITFLGVPPNFECSDIKIFKKKKISWNLSFLSEEAKFIQCVGW